MAKGTSVYFNNYNNSGEQRLLESLIIESIKIYGHDMYYIPRTLNAFDEILNEDSQSSFDHAIPIEMYIKSIDGFEGDGIFMSKFGLEIRDQVTFTVAKRIFEEEVPPIVSTITRPNEGDLIYFPMNQRLFQIRYVNYKPFMYALGALQTYDLICELFEYSNEDFNTGITDIDAIQGKYTTNILEYAVIDETGTPVIDEHQNYVVDERYNIAAISPGADNEEFEEAQEGTDTTIDSDDVIDWSEQNPFSTTDGNPGGKY